MIYRQIRSLIQRSNSATTLHQLHCFLTKTALDRHEFFLSKLILAASSISIQLARSIFDFSPVIPPIFAWNTMLREYSKSSRPMEALKIFSELQRIGLQPDKYTFPFVLKASGRCSLIGIGGSLHSMVLKVGIDSDRHINNTLLRMYSAFGVVSFARRLFDDMPNRDVVSWSSMISAYLHCRSPMDALLIFGNMKLVHEEPNAVTLVSLLAACTQLLNVRLGKCFHSYILINGISLHVALGTALLELYARSGHIEEAYHVFSSMSDKNLQSWTIMISGLADHGRGEEAVLLFERMEDTGLNPDSTLYSAVLSACSHSGLVNEGQRYFDEMVNVHGIKPRVEHYGCMVDMFGRAGKIEEAYQILRSMPMEPNSVIIRAFISAYKNHGGNLCLDKNIRKLLEMEPNLGANYVIAASLSSVSGEWDNVDDIRSAMKQKGLRKVSGSSWVQMNGSCSAGAAHKAFQ